MGYILEVDLETNLGPTEEMYCRIESFTFNKLTAELGFQVTYWLNKGVAVRSGRTFLDEEIKNQRGLINSKVISFEDSKNGEEIDLPQFIVSTASKREKVEIPVYQTKKIKKEIPYISFDENGEEVTLYRTVEIEEDFEVGKNIEIKDVIDYQQLENIYQFMYDKLKEYLTKWFSDKKIKKF